MEKIYKRYLVDTISGFLKNRMVFVGGPRQVGKTTLCLQYLDTRTEEDPGYLNWDDVMAKSQIRNAELPVDVKALCFDEIHKYKNWGKSKNVSK